MKMQAGARLRFGIGDRVQCNVSAGWVKGHILKLWDEGNPYRVRLDPGYEVWAPTDDDKFIKRVGRVEPVLTDAVLSQDKGQLHTALEAIKLGRPDKQGRMPQNSNLYRVNRVLNFKLPDGKIVDRTSLMMACHFKKKWMVEILLNYGANADVQDEHGNAALHICAENGAGGCARTLIRKGNANVDIQNEHQSEIFDGSYVLKESDGVERKVDNEHQTPLHIAAEKGDLNMAKIFILAGAKVDEQDAQGQTALWVTLEAIEDFSDSDSDSDAEDEAPKAHPIEILKLLLANDASTRMTSKLMGGGNSPIHWAIRQRQFDALSLMLKQEKAAGHLFQPGKGGMKPIHMAAQGGDLKITKLLLGMNCSPRMLDDNGHSPVYYAEKGAKRCAAVLAALKQCLEENPLGVGDRVVIQGLVKAKQYNGKIGIISWPSTDGRWPVTLEVASGSGIEQPFLKVKGKNLKLKPQSAKVPPGGLQEAARLAPRKGEW